MKRLIFILLSNFIIIAGFGPLLAHAADISPTTFHIVDNAGNPLSGVHVTVYRDFLRTTIADDLRKSGDNDASGDTAMADVSFGLASGSYEYTAELLNYNIIYGTALISSSARTINLTLVLGSASSIAPQRSAFTVSDTTLPGDGTTPTTIDVFARTNNGSVLTNRQVSMVDSRGSLDTFDANPKITNSAGRAQFLLSSSVPGKTKLYAQVDGVRISTNQEITFTGNAVPDQNQSSLSLSASSTPAGAPTNLTIVARSIAGDPLPNRALTITSNRASDTITLANPNTDATGMASASISAPSTGTSTITVQASNTLVGTVTILFTEKPSSLPSGVHKGDLIKGTESTAVYYVGRDEKRHPFPNQKTYFTWYEDFGAVKIVSAPDLASLPLGKNVTYRPGLRMIKLQTVPKVYAVAKGSILRWIETESIAQSLYGADWNKKVDDLSDAFFTNYTEGAAITATSDYSQTAELNNTTTINDELGL